MSPGGESGTVGVLEALDRHGGTFTLRDLEIAGSLARAVTAAVRAGQTRLDAAGLLRRSITDLLSMDDSVRADPAEIDGDDEPTWRLADRIARLRDVDPASVELAIEWLDALLRRRAGDERSQSWRAQRP